VGPRHLLSPAVLLLAASLADATEVGPAPTATAVPGAPAAPSPPAGEPGDAAARLLDLGRRLDAVARPLLTKYCSECHAKGESEGGVAFDRYPDARAAVLDRATWRKAAQALRKEEMPPPEKPQPTPEERAALIAWMDAAIAEGECGALGPPDPGRVTMRRLNRMEYDRTLRDLLGVDLSLSERFPADDRGYGFDNNADVLTVSPLLVEKLVAAAERALAAAVVLGDPLTPRTERADGAYLEGQGGASPAGSSPRGIFSRGALLWRRTIACDAEYALKVRASGDQAGPEPPRLVVRVDGVEAARFDVDVPRAKPRAYEARLRLAPGERRIALAFENDFYRPKAGPEGRALDRNLYVESVELRGPIGATASALPETHRRIFFVAPDKKISEADAARRIIGRFLGRAFRRPVAEEETARYLALWKAARGRRQGFEESVVHALTAALVSPHFLYRVEREPPGLAAGEAYDVPPFERASRLSYFIWASAPDEALLDAAAEGRLATPAGVAAEARRLLADPRADALVHGFARQWLELGRLEEVAPDRARFPAWSDALAEAARRETELFLLAIVREDRSILEIVDGDWTYANEALARHYGIDGVEGDEMRRVSLEGTGRRGILGHASVLALTSRPTRTSPVLRGRWLLDVLLDAPPPPPPPGAPPLEDSEDASRAASLRERMARHRADPACAGCHARIDGLGFALEEFDATGARRDRDGEHPLDLRGELPDGASVEGAAGLRRYILERKRDFARGFARRLMTWALGRGVERDGDDGCALDEVARRIEAGGWRFGAAVEAVAESAPLLRKRAEGTAAPASRRGGVLR
jgi:mono/diheme cytochrome c family protein